MTSKKEIAKEKSVGINWTPVFIIAGILGLALTIFLSYRASLAGKNIFSVRIIALFAGLLFECYRISGSWKTVAKYFVGTYLFSLFSFLPGRHEHGYNFVSHIEIWPYFFFFIFVIAFAIEYKDQITAKLTEGITLLLSISLIYWAADYGFTNYHNWFSISLMILGLLLTVFSLVNALTHIHLSKTIRLILSIWSSLIMLAFALDNIICVFRNPSIESSYLLDGLYIGLQYFLLGVSAVYVMRNSMLLANFLPGKRGNYKKDLKENVKDHIDRYSDKQLNVGQSLFCILFTGALYWLNYKYQILPRHTMIWLVFFTFPFIFNLITLLKKQK